MVQITWTTTHGETCTRTTHPNDVPNLQHTGEQVTTPYLIQAIGCDDSTEVIMHLNKDEVLIARSIADQITANGGGCAPIMSVDSLEPTTEYCADYTDPETNTPYSIKENQ